MLSHSNESFPSTTGRASQNVAILENGSPDPHSGIKNYAPIDLLVIDDLDKSFRKATGSGNPVYKGIVNNVLNCLKGKSDEQTNGPMLQPLIVVCLKGLPPTLREDSKRGDEQEGATYWRQIVDDVALRKRAVVILDSECLRRDGLKISEALSWEQTAQDFLDELQKNEQMSDLRKIGHVVVRFGTSGILHIWREKNDRHSRLYFFPNLDERSNSAPEGSVILGHSATVAAALVRALWSYCQNSNGQPFAHLLPDALEDGLIHGLRACNYLAHVGYGENPTDEPPFKRVEIKELSRQKEKWIAGFPRNLFLFTLPTGESLQYRKSIAKLNLEDEKVAKYRNMNAKVAATPVYAPPTPLWSFLSHSCRNRVSTIAVDIAVYGVDMILNQENWAEGRAAQELTLLLKLNSLQDDWQKQLENYTAGHPSDPAQDALNCVCDMIIAKVQDLSALKERPADFRSAIGRECRRIIQQSREQAAHWMLAIAPDLASQFIDPAELSQFQSSQRELSELSEMLVGRLNRKFGESLDSIDAPLARYGEGERGAEMIVVDRREIEGYRTLENLIQSHLQRVRNSYGDRPGAWRKTVERPLSIALFGPPGAGKSYAIKQIVKKVKQGLSTEDITVNLSEFTDVSQLAAKFRDIANAIGKKNRAYCVL